jgi:hypothetical protein
MTNDVVRPRVHRRLHPVDHFRRLDQRLARSVAATFSGDLVLDVDRRHARRGHVADHATDRECAAEAGVDVDQQRQSGVARVIRRASSSTSLSVVTPRSGSANDALAHAAPLR